MILPAGVAPEVRGLRAFVDGYVAVLLPAYLLTNGLRTGGLVDGRYRYLYDRVS